MSDLFKAAAKYLIPYGLYGFIKRYRTSSYTGSLYGYYKSQKIPFSPGYQEAKFELVKSILYSEDKLKLFLRKLPLPESYGILFDERVVEYPWIFANLSRDRGSKLLDVGPSLNHDFCIDYLLLKLDSEKQIVLVSLTPEKNCFYQRGVSYILSDVRSLPFASDEFDEVACISTLEHVGMDNTKYRASKEFRPDSYKEALLEMRRVLKPKGLLFITVPFGKYSSEDLRGSQQRFNKRMIDEAIQVFEPYETELTFYKYSQRGWDLSDETSCFEAEYNSDTFQDIKLYRYHPVRAGAVACIKLRK